MRSVGSTDAEAGLFFRWFDNAHDLMRGDGFEKHRETLATDGDRVGGEGDLDQPVRALSVFEAEPGEDMRQLP